MIGRFPPRTNTSDMFPKVQQFKAYHVCLSLFCFENGARPNALIILQTDLRSPMSAQLGFLCLSTVATIFEHIGFIFSFFFFFGLIFFSPLTLNTIFNYRESIGSDQASMRALLGVLCLRTVATIFELIGFIFFFFFFFFFFLYIYIFFASYPEHCL